MTDCGAPEMHSESSLAWKNLTFPDILTLIAGINARARGQGEGEQPPTHPKKINNESFRGKIDAIQAIIHHTNFTCA